MPLMIKTPLIYCKPQRTYAFSTVTIWLPKNLLLQG